MIAPTNRRGRRPGADAVKTAAASQWHRILADLAPDLRLALSKPGRHVPCPVHGGSDGLRAHRDVSQTGGMVCNTCGHFADGFAVLMWLHGWTFPQTLAAVADRLGDPQWRSVDIAPPIDDRNSLLAVESRRRAIAEALAGTIAADHQDAEPLRLYMRSRGLALNPIPAALRYHQGLAFWHDGQVLGRHPAIVAEVAGPDGVVVTVHRTYLTHDGRKAPVPEARKLMSPPERGGTNGAAIRLFEPSDALAVAEGIETAMAFHLLTDLPTWATISAGGMERVAIPASVRQVVIAADNDASGRGQKAADVLARRLVGDGRSVRIITPPTVGTDWADVLAGGIACA